MEISGLYAGGTNSGQFNVLYIDDNCCIFNYLCFIFIIKTTRTENSNSAPLYIAFTPPGRVIKTDKSCDKHAPHSTVHTCGQHAPATSTRIDTIHQSNTRNKSDAATATESVDYTNTAPNTGRTASPPTTPTPPVQQKTETDDWPQLRQIFESAGYVIKPTPRIGGVQTSLCAIGTNETIWIGAVGIKTSTLQSALDIINQIFADTLEDITINVNGFVLSPLDMGNPESPDILTFDTPSSLDKYMHEHENPPIPSDDDGNFDAFSSYISTVIEYLDKI